MKENFPIAIYLRNIFSLFVHLLHCQQKRCEIYSSGYIPKVMSDSQEPNKHTEFQLKD